MLRAQVVSGYMDPVTVAKTHVESGNGKELLLKYIAEENLPLEYGGSCRCPGGCTSGSDFEQQLARHVKTVASNSLAPAQQ